MSESASFIDQATGDQAAADLLPLVYDELRRLATNLLNHEAPGQTLQPTALVHEAYVRLTGATTVPSWQSREHFFAAAARAMRRILVDIHRRKCVFRNIVASGEVDTPNESCDPPIVDLIALDDALNLLATQDPSAARVVELRYFAGLTLDQVAESMKLSRRSVSEKWTFARSWLQLMLEGGPASEKSGTTTAGHTQ
jgi:RNA polymerase sigma factor (TIGR02999 family)